MRPASSSLNWTCTHSFPYGLSLWVQEKDGRTFTLLYGQPNPMGTLLKTVSSQGTLSLDGKLILPHEVTARLKQLGGYVQLLDATGSELASYNRPTSASIAYTLQELSLRTMYSERYGFHLSSEYMEETGRTFSRMGSGKWKRRYLIFADVMDSIDKLSGTLQRDQVLRQQTDSLREEWMKIR